MLCDGPIDERMRLCFEAFDEGAKGALDPAELNAMLLAIYRTYYRAPPSPEEVAAFAEVRPNPNPNPDPNPNPTLTPNRNPNPSAILHQVVFVLNTQSLTITITPGPTPTPTPTPTYP